MRITKAFVVTILVTQLFCLYAMRVTRPVAKSLYHAGQEAVSRNVYKYEEPLLEITKSKFKKRVEQTLEPQEEKLNKKELRAHSLINIDRENLSRGLFAGLQGMKSIAIDNTIKAASLKIKSSFSPKDERWESLAQLIQTAFPSIILEDPLSTYARARALSSLADIITHDHWVKKFIMLRLQEEHQTYESKFGINETQLTPVNLYKEIVKLPNQGILDIKEIAHQKLNGIVTYYKK
jgi:hypothetical protein